MTHEDAGHYAMKHKDRTIDPEIRTQLEKSAVDETITCSHVHRIAKLLEKNPAEIGAQVDLMELRLTECSLGLFGYGPSRKKLNDNIEVSDMLKSALEGIAPEGRTTCIQCWNLARKLKMKRVDISSACEKLSIKIKKCQLGAF